MASLANRVQKIEIMTDSKSRMHVVVVRDYPADASETEKQAVIDRFIRAYETEHGEIGPRDTVVVILDRFTGEPTE